MTQIMLIQILFRRKVGCINYNFKNKENEKAIFYQF